MAQKWLKCIRDELTVSVLCLLIGLLSVRSDTLLLFPFRFLQTKLLLHPCSLPYFHRPWIHVICKLWHLTALYFLMLMKPSLKISFGFKEWRASHSQRAAGNCILYQNRIDFLSLLYVYQCQKYLLELLLRVQIRHRVKVQHSMQLYLVLISMSWVVSMLLFDLVLMESCNIVKLWK